MSVYVVPRGTPRAVLADLTTTGATNVLAGSAGVVKGVYALHVANDQGGTASITVTATIDGATYSLWPQEQVTANNTITLELPGPVELFTASDVLTVTASSANHLHVVVHHTEYESARSG